MKGWLKPSADPKEVFPIEHLPNEVFGEGTVDALEVLYNAKKKADNIPSRIFTIDKKKEDFFSRILPILDGFDSIFKFAKVNSQEHNETLAHWLRTLEILYRRLLSTLEREGLVPIKSQGEMLDLSLHEVVNICETSDFPDNMILEELVKGYQFGRRVLRDAKVIVAKKPKKEEGR